MPTAHSPAASNKESRLGIAQPPPTPLEGDFSGNLGYLIATLVTLTALCLFHVWSRERVILLTLENSGLSRTLNEALQERERLNLQANSLQSPARVQQYAANELGMVVPSGNQVVLVRRSPATP